MHKIPLNMLKNKAKSYADMVRNRVDVTGEEAKLAADYRNLGEKVYHAVLGDLVSVMKSDPAVVELVGSIEERLRKLRELKGNR